MLDRKTCVVLALLAFSGMAHSGDFVFASSFEDGEFCPPELDVQDDGSSANGAVGLPDLVMSEINPGEYVELHNTSGFDIDLSASAEWLCSPFSYSKLSSLAPSVTIPAGGYATVPWPGNFTDVSGGGEVILYSSAAFSSSTEILDFTCWGSNPHGSRKLQAESVGKWSGICNAVLTNGALHRNATTTGISAADYDTVSAPSPSTCLPAR